VPRKRQSHGGLRAPMPLLLRQRAHATLSRLRRALPARWRLLAPPPGVAAASGAAAGACAGCVTRLQKRTPCVCALQPRSCLRTAVRFCPVSNKAHVPQRTDKRRLNSAMCSVQTSAAHASSSASASCADGACACGCASAACAGGEAAREDACDAGRDRGCDAARAGASPTSPRGDACGEACGVACAPCWRCAAACLCALRKRCGGGGDARLGDAPLPPPPPHPSSPDQRPDTGEAAPPVSERA
jgi:hypothetical protein